MKHYGDITKINGANVPLVDIITGGSPCQDLSVAGLRKGLQGERSGLFMEQIRIIKEMRNESLRQLSMRGSTYDMGCIQPRYMVWENVPGAFSSNKGEDFRAVLEETARIKDEAATIPRPENNKWSHSGCILGDGWSIAWRVHDAQFWGVPQRRKRISLVADFGGLSAPEILFERKSMSGDSEQSREERKDIASDSEGSSCETIGVDSYNLTTTGTVSKTLQAERLDNDHIPCAISFQDICETVQAHYGTGGENVPIAVKSICIGNGQADIANHITFEKAQTLNCMHDQQAVMVSRKSSWDGSQVSPTLTANNANGSQRMPDKDNFNAVIQNETGTVDACIGNGTSNQLANQDMFVANSSVVRRLTPMECERLQGYPDGWTDIGDWTDSKGKKHKGDADSPRYKALGNSIALPFWQWMAERMVQHIDHDPTMASLFDGIGGFPLVFSRCGCVPVWASEIEEFPIAVTKLRFGEDGAE